MIPPQFIQDLLTRTDIVEVVSQYVQLKKNGANHKGLCPFHNEKTPSFIVSASRQTFHCFGCAAHGNAVGFLMQHCAMGFTDAVSDLSQRVGLVVPTDERTPIERDRALEQKKKKASLADMLSQVARHYQTQIAKHPRAADYIRKRALSIDTVQRYGLGYAPAGWRFLSSVVPDYEDPRWIENGLVVAPEQTSDDAQGAQRKRYDRFRDRLMFPIRNVQGDVIGFGGRVIDNAEPKYLNSPESPVFSKGHELYGLHEARGSIREKGYALVVEGYMDVVSLSQAGCANVVATLGTACTEEQLRKLFRFTDNVVFSFDGDTAGRRAAARALRTVASLATDARSVKFLFLPQGHDPDSFVQQQGLEEFQQCIDNARPLSKHLVELAQEDCDVTLAEGRAKFLTHAKPLWDSLPDGALKRQLLDELSRHAQLQVQDLIQLWEPQRPTPSPSHGSSPLGVPKPWSQNRTAPRVRGWGTRHAPRSTEDHVLRMLLLHSEWLELLASDDQDLLANLPHPHGEIFTWLERQVAEHGPLAWGALEPTLRAQAGSGVIDQLLPPTSMDDEIHPSDLRRMLDHMWIDKLSREEKELVAHATNDPAAMLKFRALNQKLSELKKSLVINEPKL